MKLFNRLFKHIIRKTRRMDFKKFLLFGDSITEFAFNTRMEECKPDQFVLGAALCNAYAKKLDVVIRGYSGYNSRWGLKILPKILGNERNISLGTIFFGSNDSCLGGHQKVPLHEYKSNIREMLSMFKANNIKPILIGPALYDRERFEAPRQEEIKKGYIRTPENFKLYSDALQKIAQEERIPYVNLNTAFQKKGGDNWKELLCDGLHFSGKGYEVFFNELMEAIRSFYPEYSPESLEYNLPEWRDVAEDGSNLDDFL